MTDCETCGKPLGPGDGLGCARCMGASRYVATIEQRRELVQKANRESQSRKKRTSDDKGNRLRDVGNKNTKGACCAPADADTTQCRRDASKAVGEAQS